MRGLRPPLRSPRDHDYLFLQIHFILRGRFNAAFLVVSDCSLHEDIAPRRIFKRRKAGCRIAERRRFDGLAGSRGEPRAPCRPP